MTTVAFDGLTMAADSRGTDDDAGIVKCQKIYRKRLGKRDCLIGIAGDEFAALVFIDWYGSGKPVPHELISLDPETEDFGVMIWDGRKLWQANRFCRPVEILDKKFAIGSGAQFALAAMDCGKTAKQAVQLACRRDCNSGGPVVTEAL
jgi:ATP-dependent protease HslVU (ClpYQ) peptidase subunit